jgi:hypothetical protein
MQPIQAEPELERRARHQFSMRRELRYVLLKDRVTAEFGAGETMDLSSGSVAFSAGAVLPVGSLIELSISWPVLLDETCPMRLVVFGRVVRSDSDGCSCTIDKYEFRTQARTLRPAGARSDVMLRRWAETVRRDPHAGLVRRGGWSGEADHGTVASSVGGDLWRAVKSGSPRPAETRT